MALKIKKKEVSQTEVQREIQMRINVALWAYAYEIEDDPMVDDGKFDKVCGEIDVDFPTGHKVMDKWFKDNFDPYTGQWIHKHPDIAGIQSIYNRLKARK